jgi:predicted lipoprotein with Yx(FWY)xxD motif
MKKFAVLLAISVSAIAAATAFGSSKTVVGTGHTSLGTVLVDSHGHTLYLFEGDTSKRLGCNGSCLTSWIPVSGKASATGSTKASALGTIKRGSSSQVTYSGHPLYTFVGDTKAGQVTGQGLILNAKKWYVIASSGAAMTASAKGSSGSGGGSAPAGW